MSNDNHSIIWQKWFDPFGLDDNLDVPDIDNLEEEFSNFISSDTDDNTDVINNDNYLEHKKFKGRVKVLATPMGIIPLNDNTASNKIFNFWLGHTNFDITHHIARIIELTDGVETLDVFTRYRFRIAVGKAFDDSNVMREINSRVYAELTHVEH